MRIDDIRAQCERWESASAAIAKNKSYTIDGLTYTRQDADQVREMLDYWTKRLAAALTAGQSIRRQQARLHDWGCV